jgi:hypothetical protein
MLVRKHRCARKAVGFAVDRYAILGNIDPHSLAVESGSQMHVNTLLAGVRIDAAGLLRDRGAKHRTRLGGVKLIVAVVAVGGMCTARQGGQSRHQYHSRFHRYDFPPLAFR